MYCASALTQLRPEKVAEGQLGFGHRQRWVKRLSKRLPVRMQRNQTALWCHAEEGQDALLQVEEHAHRLQPVGGHRHGLRRLVVQHLHPPPVARHAPRERVASQPRAVPLALPLDLGLAHPHLPAALVCAHPHLPVVAAAAQGAGGQCLREAAEARLVVAVGLLRLAVARRPLAVRQLQLGMGRVFVQRGDATVCTGGAARGKQRERRTLIGNVTFETSESFWCSGLIIYLAVL